MFFDGEETVCTTDNGFFLLSGFSVSLSLGNP